jgi:hypothetical protein
VERAALRDFNLAYVCWGSSASHRCVGLPPGPDFFGCGRPNYAGEMLSRAGFSDVWIKEVPLVCADLLHCICLLVMLWTGVFLPNFLAGLLVALAVRTWANLFIGCLGWAFVFCAFLWIEGRREEMEIYYYREHPNRLLSPLLTFYTIEWKTALIISLVFSVPIFIIRNMFL